MPNEVSKLIFFLFIENTLTKTSQKGALFFETLFFFTVPSTLL